MGFDYEVLHRCQYEIGGGDCGEPAPYKVWWLGEVDSMIVCQEHFEFIREVENIVKETTAPSFEEEDNEKQPNSPK